jgi:hypothetical protein
MQLNYNLGPIPGIPGQIFDLSAIDVISAVAGEIIPPGIEVELNSSGLLVACRDLTADWPPTGATGKATFQGISINDPAGFEQGYFPFAVPPTTAGSTGTGYPKGAVVPILRKGRIWHLYDGAGTPTRGGAFNVWHSSDGTSARGVLTFLATSATVGAEIGAAPAGLSVWNPGLLAGVYTDGFGVTWGVCGVNINL